MRLNLPARLAALVLASSAPTALAASPPAVQATPAQEIPFDSMGKAFMAFHCPGGASAEVCDFGDLVDANYVSLEIGFFDVRYPRSFLKDKERAKELGEVGDALARLQMEWIRWLAEPGESASAAISDLQQLQSFASAWKPANFVRFVDPKKGAGPSVMRELAKEEALAAAARLDEYLLSAEALGLAPQKKVRILIAPTRRHFMELLSYAAMYDPKLKDSYWVDGADQWTQFWIDWTLVLALEYAPWEKFDPAFARGLDVKKFDKTGLTEHVVQQSMLALLYHCMPGREQGHFESALSMMMAIDVAGQVNTIDGEGALRMTGASTAPYSRFVPGGNSSGGWLPAIPAAPFNALASNPWRKGAGKDFFVGPLAKGKKAGQKQAKKDKVPRAKDKDAHFLLQGPENGKKVVSAPFLGSHANERDYPEFEFLIDYREFFRSYKCAFFQWLRTKSQPDPDKAQSSFRALLRSLPDLDKSVPIGAKIAERYGLPLSAENGEVDSLEWRFLRWLN